MILAACALPAAGQPHAAGDSLEREHVVGSFGAVLDAQLARFADGALTLRPLGLSVRRSAFPEVLKI
jgi:hypothetical protein